ncbi:ABC transporter permease [Microbulbifer hydrolyticus]|uniref:Transport permease protein n=1 Tax=Microbulbifer hydrolyticus TaxID=48074 RepID=A0A6P1TEH5_9GAMM|nr:ABC transporter permease [Microbulbifer hydrolyticus]MBB5212433.1 ABC-2 type transport system permease protein [Microbulbifer hydrolyticus]QHQ40065.1 ABC transporter permease [Microbulbifer hydrolyticus]
MNWRRLFAVLVKEFRQLRRDRMTLAMIIGIPIMQLVLFGYAINLNLRNLPAAIADQSNTSASRRQVMDMLATGVIEPVADAETPEQLMELLRRGEISVGIAIPYDYERRLARGQEAIQILVDGSDTVVQSAAAQLAQVPVGEPPPENNTRLPDRQSSIPLPQRPVSIVSFYNPQRISAINIVPGLIGIILTMTMVMFTSVAIVRERERGNMELLIATPVSSAELMIGKILPYGMIGLIQTSLILLLGKFLFQVPIRGSLLDVYIAALLLILANLAMGLLISTRAQSQFQAMQMTFFVFLPSILLSGFMFPFDGMPHAAQWLAELLPLTHFIRLIRGVMLRGAGILELWPDLVALIGFILLMMTLAILRFRKRLD